MREHLFRGKRKDSGEWIEGGYCHKKVGEYLTEVYIVEARTDGVMAHYRVDPETVGQFTGLKDKDGKRIFEGDIVHCIARLDEADCVVLFEDGEFRLVPTERYATYVTGGGFYALRNFEKEVIGNIHDNPELMEVRDGKEV